MSSDDVKRYKVQVTGGCAVVLVCINGREQFSADVVVDAEDYTRDIKALETIIDRCMQVMSYSQFKGLGGEETLVQWVKERADLLTQWFQRPKGTTAARDETINELQVKNQILAVGGSIMSNRGVVMLGKAKLYREISWLEAENDRLRIEWRNETLELDDLKQCIGEAENTGVDWRYVAHNRFDRLMTAEARLAEAEKQLEGCRND